MSTIRHRKVQMQRKREREREGEQSNFLFLEICTFDAGEIDDAHQTHRWHYCAVAESFEDSTWFSITGERDPWRRSISERWIIRAFTRLIEKKRSKRLVCNANSLTIVPFSWHLARFRTVVPWPFVQKLENRFNRGKKKDSASRNPRIKEKFFPPVPANLLRFLREFTGNSTRYSRKVERDQETVSSNETICLICKFIGGRNSVI